MNFSEFSEEIKRLFRCGHCLNFGAKNAVTIPTKKINGELHNNGLAVALMCDDHKDAVPTFATQVYNDGVSSIRVSELPDSGIDEQKKIEKEEEDAIEQKAPLSDETAEKIAEEIEESRE